MESVGPGPRSGTNPQYSEEPLNSPPLPCISPFMSATTPSSKVCLWGVAKPPYM